MLSHNGRAAVLLRARIIAPRVRIIAHSLMHAHSLAHLTHAHSPHAPTFTLTRARTCTHTHGRERAGACTCTDLHAQMRPLLAVICMEQITGSFPSIPVQSCCSHLALSVPTYWHAQVWLVLAVVHRNQQQWADALECIENALAVSLCASRRSANRGSGESAPARAARLSAACDAQLVEKDASADDENLTSQIQARLLRAQAAAANECPSSLVYSSARGVPPPAPDAPTHCPVCGPTHWRLRPHEPTGPLVAVVLGLGGRLHRAL